MSISTLFVAQVNEVGVFLGGTNYIGDVGRTNYIYPNEVGYGLIYKWNWNPRIALRGTLTSMPIAANDDNADNFGRTNRGYEFTNKINEIALGIEFNFYEYDLSSVADTWTPYLLLELAAFNYSVVQKYTNSNPPEIIYTDKTSYAVPFGFGIKSKLADKLAIAFETRFRYTFVDDIDYTTEKFTPLNFGGKGKDWYVFTGISLVYTFGRPACYTEGF